MFKLFASAAKELFGGVLVLSAINAVKNLTDPNKKASGPTLAL